MTDARSDWEARIGRRSEATAAATEVELAAPQGLRASPGRGQVTLEWDPVEGAVGYLVHVAPSPGGPFQPLDHGGRDVLAVPYGPYADTTAIPGETRWYAVAGVVDVERVGPLSAPVAATADPAGSGAVDVAVAARTVGELDRPWRPMIGSEHLSTRSAATTAAAVVSGRNSRRRCVH